MKRNNDLETQIISYAYSICILASYFMLALLIFVEVIRKIGPIRYIIEPLNGIITMITIFSNTIIFNLDILLGKHLKNLVFGYFMIYTLAIASLRNFKIIGLIEIIALTLLLNIFTIKIILAVIDFDALRYHKINNLANIARIISIAIIILCNSMYSKVYPISIMTMIIFTMSTLQSAIINILISMRIIDYRDYADIQDQLTFMSVTCILTPVLIFTTKYFNN